MPPEKNNQDLPAVPKLSQTLGPSFILLGLALGSGEIIMWPYLVANWGLGIIWGAMLGITFQFVLNTEIMRYTLFSGESVFMGFRRLSRLWPAWFVISTLVPWGLPGFSSAASQIISRLLGLNIHTSVAAFLLLLAGVLLTAGRTVYKTLERWQKTVILISVPFFLGLVIIFTRGSDWLELLAGLAGRGDGWWFLPQTIPVAAFLGAFVYSGAGGNLNFAQSYYIKEKGFGMGKFTPKITSLFAKDKKLVPLEGHPFRLTDQNMSRWKEWWRLVNLEHGIVFWLLGFLTIVLLATLSRALVYGQGSVQGLDFLYQEASVVGQALGVGAGVLFLVVVALALYSTQIIVLESASRIISENLLLIRHRTGQKVNASLAFYGALWAQILFGIIVLSFGLKEPRLLLTMAAVLNAFAMTVAFPLMLFLNRRFLPRKLQPHLLKTLIILAAFLFLLYFSVVTVLNLV